jgi:hypothetical protein
MKTTMLGIQKLSPGRMGNRLFHYHFLRQIAQKTGIQFFHIQFPEETYFYQMGKRPRGFSLFKKTIEITSREVIQYKPTGFIQFLMEEHQKGADIVFSPPMLGEVFFDYLFFDPNEFVKIKDRFQIDFNHPQEKAVRVGLHFRGTDFPAWNQHAALNFEYYRKAVQFCLDYYGKEEISFALFTDDAAYPAYVSTLEFLKSIQKENIFMGDKTDLPIFDFYKMSQCDVLISSPSTFAIFAGIIGKQKKIIHNKAWLDYATNRNDPFWVNLCQTDHPYYSLWKSF